MANVTVQSRVHPDLKMQSEEILAAIGLSTSDGIRLFLQQVVNIGGLPFQPITRRPNTETLEAMRETDEGRSQSVTLPEFRHIMGLKP